MLPLDSSLHLSFHLLVDSCLLALLEIRLVVVEQFVYLVFLVVDPALHGLVDFVLVGSVTHPPLAHSVGCAWPELHRSLLLPGGGHHAAKQIAFLFCRQSARSKTSNVLQEFVVVNLLVFLVYLVPFG